MAPPAHVDEGANALRVELHALFALVVGIADHLVAELRLDVLGQGPLPGRLAPRLCHLASTVTAASSSFGTALLPSCGLPRVPATTNGRPEVSREPFGSQ